MDESKTSQLEKFRETLSASFDGYKEQLPETEQLEDFIYKVNGTIHRLLQKGGHRFMLCVDGSAGSSIAYSVTRHLTRPKDSVTIFHAYRRESSDHSLLPKYRPEEVRRTYAALAIADFKPESRHSMVWAERAPDQSVIETLQKHLGTYDYAWSLKEDKSVLSQNPPDFVILGMAGRGRAKDSSNTLGHNAMTALRMLHTPCIVAKSMCPSDSPQSFIYAVNGSERSEIGLEILLQLVYSCDSLTIIHVDDGMQSTGEQLKSIQDYYETALRRYGPRNTRFSVLSLRDDEDNVQDAIVRIVNSKSPDFFALAPRAKSSLSDMSQFILENVRCSIILCKN